MVYRTLENTKLIYIYEAFIQAFFDYQVSVDMTFKSFETILKRNTLSCEARQPVGYALRDTRMGMIYFMLRKFALRNYKNFRDEIEINLNTRE